MKGVSTKVLVTIIATVLIAASSPSVSFPIAGSDSATEPSFSNRNLEPERLEECCQSCENQQAVSTMAYDNDGTKSISENAQHESHSLSDINDDHNYDRRAIRVLTWAESKQELQTYAKLYSQSHPEAPAVRIFDVPSLKDLDYEITSELRLGSIDFDGFAVPPLLMGGMLKPRRGQALATWNEEEMFYTTPNEEQNEWSLLDDLLPYYRYNVATYGGKIRGLPIIAGSQALILFRKDYLDALKLPTPKTWEDWTIIAAAFANQNDMLLGNSPGGKKQNVHGACLGLLNDAGCRRRNSLGGKLCKSQTMTYLGMMMASMTQYEGNSTGFMMGIDDASPNGLDPLFRPTIERILKWMERQIENGTPHSLGEDSYESMENFRDGRCAWTISIDHDNELLKDDNIGFVPLPGSNQVFAKRGYSTKSRTGAAESMKNCTRSCGRNCQQSGSAVHCPYGKDFAGWGSVNQVPFGAVDALVGTVSGLISHKRQEETKKFFKFVLASDVHHDSVVGQTLQKRIYQPLTFSGLERSDVPNYEETMKSLTSSSNAAIPFRVPNAYSLLSDLDDRIYNYLVDGIYSNDRREQFIEAAEKSWQMIISMYDSRNLNKRQPTSAKFYELSLGISVPAPSTDLYIGWGARGVMWILASLSCLLSVCFALWVFTYQHERVIRASQPVFLYLICAGTFVMALSVFTLGIEDDIASVKITSITCMATYYLFSLGFTAVISVLFSKMWMLGQVFQKPRNEQRIQITKQNILVPFFIVFGLDCLVLIVWTLLDQQRWVRMPILNNDPYSLAIDDGSTVGWCVSDHTSWYLGLLGIFNIAILLLSLVQSYECRRITTEYAESGWVTIAIATTAQAWFIGLPLCVLWYFNPTSWFILRSSTVLCTTYPTLLLIFVPKIKYSFEAMKKHKKRQGERLSAEHAKKTLFDGGSNEISVDTIDSATNTKGSSNHSDYRRLDPKGTIGIRIIQFTNLDSDEVDELEDAVEYAARRNKELKDEMGRLKDRVEEYRFTRTHMLSSVPRYSFKSKASESTRSLIISSDMGSIIEAKPESIRHSRISRRDTYFS